MSVEIESKQVEATETPAAPVADQGATPKESAPESVSPTEGQLPPGGESSEEAAVPASYKPREKFKVMIHGSDEQQEHDVPDFLKQVMKDEKSEKEAIALLEKAYGLDPVKASRQQIREERDKIKQEFGAIQNTIKDVRTAYQRGDIDAFLEKLAIPQERMLQWALDKVNYSQLPPEQKQALDQSREAQRKAYAAEQQVQSYQEQLAQQASSAKQAGLNAGLARPEVKSVAESYDSQVGKPGAFMQEVISLAQLAYTQSNGQVDLTPDQAIEQVITKYKPFLRLNGAPTGGQPSASQVSSQAGPGVQAPSTGKPAVIPNVLGRSQSPVKSAVRSLDDLKKLSAAAQRS